MEPARQGQESAWWSTALRPGNLPYTLSLTSPSEASECKLTPVNILALVNWSQLLTTPPTPPTLVPANTSTRCTESLLAIDRL
jgi:hypothetical protein